MSSELKPTVDSFSPEDRTARELIWQLKSTFLSNEFQKVEKILTDREIEMKNKLDITKTKCDTLELKCLRLEAECKEHKRETEEMRENVTSLIEDSSLLSEREKRAEERCVKLSEALMESQADNKKLIDKIEVSNRQKHRVEEELAAWRRKYEGVDARVSRLEQDVILLLNQDPSLKRKIEQQLAAANRDQVILTSPGAGSTTCDSLKNEFTGAAGKKPLVVEEEGFLAGSQQPKASVVIDIDDSDDEKPLDTGRTSIEKLKRKRASSGVKRELDDDDDDQLPIGRMKLKKLQELDSLHKASPAVSHRSYDRSPIKPCTEKPEGKLHSQVFSDTSDSDDSSEDENHNVSTDRIIANIRSKRENKEWAHEADMIQAFDTNHELCLHALCALHRQRSKGNSFKNSLSFSSHGFNMTDAKRIYELGVLLTNGDTQGKLKKSVSELEQSDFDDCRKLAKRYSTQLFVIYEKKDDPFFLSSQFR